MNILRQVLRSLSLVVASAIVDWLNDETAPEPEPEPERKVHVHKRDTSGLDVMQEWIDCADCDAQATEAQAEDEGWFVVTRGCDCEQNLCPVCGAKEGLP
jgi:hypothetical protein